MLDVSSDKRPSRLVVGGARRAQRKQIAKRWRYINEFISFRERILVALASIVIVVSAVFMVAYHYYSTTVVVPAVGGNYTEAIVGQPQYINPILAQTNDVDLDLVHLMFSSLFKLGPDQTLQKDLVSDYTVSTNQLTYTLYLRRDAVWQRDQTPVTAADVLFTIHAIQNPALHSPLEPSLRNVQVKKIDDYTISLTLVQPFAPFLSNLTFGVLPEYVWSDIVAGSLQNISLSDYNSRPIGSGQWQFSSLIKDSSGEIKNYTLVPFKQYYGQGPYLQNVTFQFYMDRDSAIGALKNKQVDGLAFVPADQDAQLRTSLHEDNFYDLKLPQYTALFFNQTKSTILSDVAVRQALVWGINRTRIITDALNGRGEPIFTPIFPGYLGYNTQVEKYGFDLDKGSALLDKAGWTLPAGAQYRTKNNKTLEFTVNTLSEPQYQKVAQLIKISLGKMGVKVNVDSYSATDIQDQIIKPRNYEALLFGEELGFDTDPYAFWHSTQMKDPGLALAVFYQKNIDDLLSGARKTNDTQKRTLSYYNFQNILAEQLPAIFLYNPLYSYAINRSVQGVNFQYISQPADRFTNIAQWYTKTQRIKK